MKNKNHSVKPKEKIATTPNMTLLFAMGFSAIASVLLFGYVYVTNHEHASQSVVKVRPIKGPKLPPEIAAQLATEQNAEMAEDVLAGQQGQEANIIKENHETKLPYPKSEMVLPPEEVLQGFWVFQVHKNATAELSILDDKFQLIYADQSQAPIRKFSRGFVSYDAPNGRLTLRPDNAVGAPEPMRGVQYEILTTRSFDMDVLQARDGEDLYVMPPQEHVKSRAIHPLFLFSDYNGPHVLKLSPLVTQEP